MGNIINDIVEEVTIKPNKSKLIIKWIVSVSISLIGVAFVFGQFKSSFFNRMDKFEESINKTTIVIETMNKEMNDGFDDVNARIDKGYSDGLRIVKDYQEFNKRQLILVLDYGHTNKELLKEMLEMNMQEKTKSMENEMLQSKNEPIVSTENPNLSIAIRRADPPQTKNYLSLVHIIEAGTKDTIFSVTGATMDFINKIDTEKYKLGAIIGNNEYPKLYDFSYRKK